MDMSNSHTLAMQHHFNGQHQEALELLKQLIHQEPENPALYNDLGIVLEALQDPISAQQAYQKSLTLAPDYTPAWFNLGVNQQEQRQLDVAAYSYQQVLQQDPLHAKAHNNLGQILLNQGKTLQALRHLNQALQLTPDSPQVHINLGVYYQECFQWPLAIQHLKMALKQDPLNPEAWFNLANVYQESGQLDLASESYQHLLQLSPNHPQGHYNHAMLLFLQGELKAGFAEFEWRWQCPNYQPRPFNALLWQGEVLTDKTLLVHAEQGYGDTLQFIRYLKHLPIAPENIILECQPPLKSLLQAQPDYPAWIYAAGEALPHFDYHVPLLSLPQRLQLQEIPSKTPYLTVSPFTPQTLAPGNKVGLVWASGYRPHMPETWRLYKIKSCPWNCFKTLLEVPHIQFFSLQSGPHDKDLIDNESITDLSPQLTDFLITAQWLTQLDLVITVDTAVAHLAGALGIPTWLLLPHQAYWFWGSTATQTPWYPSMQLWHQPTAQNWPALIHQVKQQLALWAEPQICRNIPV